MLKMDSWKIDIIRTHYAIMVIKYIEYNSIINYLIMLLYTHIFIHSCTYQNFSRNSFFSRLLANYLEIVDMSESMIQGDLDL